MIKVGHNQWCLDDDTVDRWSDADRYALYTRIKGNLTLSPATGVKKRWKFYKILSGGMAGSKSVRQVELALSHRTPPAETSRRIPTDVIRKIEVVSNGATRKTLHRHLETSIDYYQERDEGLVPVYRKIDREHFIEATTRGRPGTITAAEQRVIQQWADGLQPVIWPKLPPVEQLERCGQCIGMGRMSWRGSWFGGVEEQLMRLLFWKLAELRSYLESNGIKPGVLNLVYKTARNRPMAKTHLMTPSRKFSGRLAVIAVMLANGLIDTDGEHREGSMWNLNRLLPLDASRWMNVQYDWKSTKLGGEVTSIRDLLVKDHATVHGWISHPTTYPAAYNCEAVQLWPVLEQSAWFWAAFIDVINGRGWGNSQAARFIRGEI